ncbi:glycosyltransferase family A protein [Agrobacterium sp.]|jgi:hypothetical protein|uniref:glycosyltransferase family 2 protein n=1 Tax=Agrobacterium sp. TaxID=361 RepID=UPI0028B153CF|nr:glycosyltransferase family A protein [Agrobacterium sp.]
MSENILSGKALIFMTARNCEMYAASSLASLARQTHDNLHVLYIDDCSDDATGDIAQQYLSDLFPDRHTYIRNATRYGKARNAWEHLGPRAKDAEFIAVLDGDDQLIDVEILERMAASYSAGEDIVWTNYVTDGGMVGGNSALDPHKNPRTQGWKTSHFFSFRAKLLDNVPESYFKNQAGEWFPAACDIALALPMLDQTRKYEFIPVNAYRYTSFNPYSHHNLDAASQGLNSTIQRQCAQEVFNKKPLPLLYKVADSRDSSAQNVAITGGANSAEAIWAHKAAELLVVACPMLLNAQAVIGEDSLSPMQIWSLYQSIMQKPGSNILHIGKPNSAIYLAAIASGMPEISLTCITSSSEQTRELEALLAGSGFLHVATIVESSMGTVTIGNKTGPFLNMAPLGGTDKFSIVLLDSREEENERDFVEVSLSSIAGLLEPTGFKFNILSRDKTAVSSAANAWSRMSSGLKFCLNGIGGTGLVVIGGR